MCCCCVQVYHRSLSPNLLAARQQSRLMKADGWPDRAHQMLAVVGLCNPLSSGKDAFSRFVTVHEPAERFWPAPGALAANPNADADEDEDGHEEEEEEEQEQEEGGGLEDRRLARISKLERLVEPGKPVHMKYMFDNLNKKHYNKVAAPASQRGELPRGAPLYSREQQGAIVATDQDSAAEYERDRSSVATTVAALGGMPPAAVATHFQSQGGLVNEMWVAHYAVAAGLPDLIRLFDQSHWRVECHGGQTPAHMLRLTPVGQLPATMAAILATGPAGVLNFRTADAGTPLALACRLAALDAAHLLTAGILGCQPVRGPLGRTPLHWAAAQDAATIVTRLVENVFADPVLQDNYGATPIHHAVQNSAWAAARALLKMGADPSVPTGAGETALHLAAEQNQQDGDGSDEEEEEEEQQQGDDVPDLSWLVSGALELSNIEARRASDSRTALHLACAAGNAAFVGALLEGCGVRGASGADVFRQSGHDDLPVICSLERWKPEIRVLLAAAANLDTRCRHAGPCKFNCPCVKARRPCTGLCWSDGEGNPHTQAAAQSSRHVKSSKTTGMFSKLDATVSFVVEMDDSPFAAPLCRVAVTQPTDRELMMHSSDEAAFAADFFVDVHAQILGGILIKLGAEDVNKQIVQKNDGLAAGQEETALYTVCSPSETRPGMAYLARTTELPTALHKSATTRVLPYQPNSTVTVRGAACAVVRETGRVEQAKAQPLMRTRALAVKENAAAADQVSLCALL